MQLVGQQHGVGILNQPNRIVQIPHFIPGTQICAHVRILQSRSTLRCASSNASIAF